jgi:outer membrane protein OmpA-like peptidoglycan-associated protein
MNAISKIMFAVATVAVAGCTNLPGSNLGGTFTADSYLDKSIEGEDFGSSLSREYQALAARNASTDVNWMDTTAYIAKSEQGAAAQPWTPAELGVSSPETDAKYDEAVAIITANKDARPAECAHAQAMWDQYLESLYQGGVCVSVEDAEAMLASALAACAPAQFTIYFGFDKDTLDAAANTVVGNIVSAASALSNPLLSVVGHTDTVGSVAYNQGLSERRANRVAGALEAEGVARDAMTVAGRSENELAVPTGDNVREPRNRRVEVNISQ